VQVSNGGANVHRDARVGDTLEQLRHLLEVAVGGRAAARPVKERGRDGVVAGVREAPGDVLDVVVHTGRLVDDDHRSRRAILGRTRVEPHRAIGSVERDVGDRHTLVLAATRRQGVGGRGAS
jgi:hypothetical protein